MDSEQLIGRITRGLSAEQASREQLGPIAWWASNARGDEALSASLVDTARVQIVYWEVQRRIFLALAAELKRAGVFCCFLKGVDLNLRWYPEPGLRPMVDVDVLVREGDRGVFREIAERLGWRRIDIVAANPAHEAFEEGWRDPATGVIVEVHWHVDWPEAVSVDTDTLLRRRQIEKVDGVPVFDPLDLLVHLAVHSLRDARAPARRTVLDAWFVIDKLRPDWGELAERAREWGARSALFVLLERMRRFAGLESPKSMLRSLRVGWLAPLAADWLAASLEVRPILQREWAERALRLSLIDSFWRRAGFGGHYLRLRLAGIGTRGSKGSD